jgi:hypothetical protein
MKKYDYNIKEKEKLTNVIVDKVWLKEDLLSNDSAFKRMYPDVWKLINEGIDAEDFPLSELNKIIKSNDELYIVIITTETYGEMEGVGRRKLPSKHIRQKAFLTDRRSFIDITIILGLTNFVGCRFQHINPPFEDFVAEFIGEKYF